MAINPIQPIILPGATGAASTSSSSAAASAFSGMGGDQFMQLLMAEMENQDPLDPVQDKDFMAQITQINSLMEMDKVSTNMQTLTLSNQMIQAAGLIGKEVSYANADGTTKSGVVSGVTYQGSSISVTVGDTQVDLSDITGVQANAGLTQASND